MPQFEKENANKLAGCTMSNADTMKPLTSLPPAPQQKVDPPAVFSDKAEVFVGSFVKLVDEFNNRIIPAHNSLVEPMTQVLIHLPTIKAAPVKAAEAAVSAAAALASQKAAATSEGNAKASENIAKSSEAVAVSKAGEASASATAAAVSEANAKASELAAKSSEISALNSKNAASVSAIAAAVSEANAFADAERSKRYADDVHAEFSNVAVELLVPQIVTDAVKRATDKAVDAADRATADAGRAESARDTSEEIAGKLLKDYQVEVHMVEMCTEVLKLKTFVTKHISEHHHGWEGEVAGAIEDGAGGVITANVVEV